MSPTRQRRLLGALLLAGPGLAAATGEATSQATSPEVHVVRRETYDGVTDDLVTGGAGMAALVAGSAKATVVDPLRPTYAELRRMNLLRPGADANGYGRLFGPNVDPATGSPTPGEHKIAGEEILAYADDADGRRNVAMLLQIPASFRPERACLVVVATPGSSNIWTDMQRGGYWGLVRGCAVAWTDKGLGAAIHDIDSDQVVLVDGSVKPAAEGDRAARMRAIEPAARTAFAASYPHRMAFGWSHAGWTQEAQWGRSVLRTAAFALAELEAREWPGGATVTRATTKVIASGFSNGGGAVLKAAEQDADGLIDGVVALSPQIMSAPDPRVTVTSGGKSRAAPGRTIFDGLTYANLYRPCAALAVPDGPGLASLTFAANRCRSLAEAGLLKGASEAEQAKESLDLLHVFGFQPEADIEIAWSSLVEQGTLGQANQYGRFSVADRLCDLSFAPVGADGRPVAADPARLAQLFGREPSGTPDGRAVTTVNDADTSGPRQSTLSVSKTTARQDYNLDAARCLRELAVGSSERAHRVQEGLRSVLATGALRGKPTLIVHGRADPVEQPDFTSRPLLGLNALVDGPESRLRYIEVTNGVHGDPDQSTAGLGARFIPISVYQVRALEAMYATLFEARALPPSQVVHTRAPSGQRGGKPAVEAADLPPLKVDPGSDARITVVAGHVTIPD